MYKIFKGSDSEYRTLHYWVEKQLGKPAICIRCDRLDAKRYHWANISGEYKKDIIDWIRLCNSCHMKMDNDLKCRKGHIRTIKNTYINPEGYRECIICRKKGRKDYYWKHKLSP